MMDWFSWLSKSNLDAPLVREYSFRLTSNELEEDDLAFFDHAFLQSIGISVAKHRAEILDLAKKTRHRSSSSSSRRLPLRLRPPPPLPAAASKLAAAIRRSRNCFARYMGALGCSTTSARPATWALSPTRSGARWSGATLRRKTKVGLLKKGRPMGADRRREGGGGGHGLYRYSSAGGGTRWDAMFQNLKPT